jgi:hypothetical protein
MESDRSSPVATDPSFVTLIPAPVAAAPAKIVPTDGKTMVAPADWSNAKRPPVAPPYTMDWMAAARLPKSHLSIGSL